MAKHRRRVSRVNQPYSAGNSSWTRIKRSYHIRQQRSLRRQVVAALHALDLDRLDQIPTKHTQLYHW